MKPPIHDAPNLFMQFAVNGPNQGEMQRGLHQSVQRNDIPTSQTVENLMGAWAQRCDRLMAEFQAALAAPLLFLPLYVIDLFNRGNDAEKWVFYWNRQRG